MDAATYGTPAGWWQRCAHRDRFAEHQIRIDVQTPGHEYLTVGCTCLGRYPLRRISTAEEALAAWRRHIEHVVSRGGEKS